MLIWIPVVFSCLVGGQCGFVYDVPTYSESKCLESLQVMKQDISMRPEVYALEGTCLPVSSV